MWNLSYTRLMHILLQTYCEASGHCYRKDTGVDEPLVWYSIIPKGKHPPITRGWLYENCTVETNGSSNHFWRKYELATAIKAQDQSVPQLWENHKGCPESSCMAWTRSLLLSREWQKRMAKAWLDLWKLGIISTDSNILEFIDLFITFSSQQMDHL